jgi:O-acetyl-ADP-ribose deacetylase (regulator of RNase III)
MGKGIAKDIKKKFPEAYEVDCSTKKGDKSKLGTITFTKSTEPVVANCYTQYRYGNDGRLYCDYDALRSCMKNIKKNFSGKKIGLPKIGCSLAGGDWNIVSKIIAEELGDENITIMLLRKD